MEIEMKNKPLLAHAIPGIEQVPHSFSQIAQDFFVLACLKGLTNGRYCEIGAYHPMEISNTYILEKYYNWTGVSFDINQQSVDLFNKHRSNPAFLQDAMTADYADYFQKAGYTDNIIDYASVDCEPPENTLRALQQLLSSGYKFRVITFEHDTYNSTLPIKQLSRDILTAQGYELIVGGLMGSPNFHDYEDWWVHPDLVDMDHVEKFKCAETNIFWRDYVYGAASNG